MMDSMDLVEIKKNVRSQTAKRVAQAVVNTGDPALLPAKTPPVKRAPRTRNPAAKKAAAPPPPAYPTPKDPVKPLADRLESRMKFKEAKAEQIKGTQAKHLRSYADSLEARMKAKEATQSATARRKKLQTTATAAAGGTAAVVGGALAARQAMKLRHLPAPGGLSNTQRAMIGAGAGASTGMLLHERSTRR